MMDLFSIEGRTSRGPYFWHTFLDGVVMVGLCLVVLMVFGNVGGAPAEGLAGVLSMSLVVGILITGVIAEICVTVRRFHDLGRPGWHYLLLTIPFYNVYLVLALLFQRGDSGPNQYGPDPLSRFW